MADYSLKDEKRINVNGEWDKVTTHPNNEPIFRQNGYKLVFDSANSDYLGLSKSVSNGDKLIFELTFNGSSGDNQYVFSGGGSFRSYFLDSVGVLQVAGCTLDKLYINGVDSSTTTDLRQHYGAKLKIEYTVTGSFSLNYIGSFSNSAWFSNANIYLLTLNGETFNPIDIDSNGQIEGSNGTVATFNTSHASGLSYILGTVFQKCSFALEFDSGNSEHLSLSEGVVNGDKLVFELTFNSGTGDNQYIFSGGGSFRSFFVDGVGQLTQAGCTLDKLYIDGVDSPLNTDLQQNYGAKLRLEYTVTGSFSLNYICSFSDSAWFSNVDLFNYSINGTNYPLTEGLGNTTNGATINTSHADGIKRINFGMWLQGNDTDGWTPYTIV